LLGRSRVLQKKRGRLKKGLPAERAGELNVDVWWEDEGQRGGASALFLLEKRRDGS